MRLRKKTSGGQAIVMVTVALIAMCGMMGLAVDLGWSFFVKKQAQAAADGAALAAVQEAFKRNGGGAGSLTCGANADCQPIQPCSSIAPSSNLANGCAYATSNGFTAGGQNGRQNVTIQADVTKPVPTAPGVNDIKYWVTVRTWQSMPQLFSSVLGNREGTAAAIATAGIAGSIVPGSFYGMNHENDCLTGLGGTARANFNCGVDVDLGGTGTNNPCFKMDGSASGFNAKLCAPAGVFLSSQCKGVGSISGCTDSGSTTQNYAGHTANNPTVWSESGTQIRGDGWVDRPGNWTPSPPGVSNQSSADFGDPTRLVGPQGQQPPIVNPSQPPCPILNGVLTAGTVGPYQYYAVNASGTATGAPLTIANNATVTFDPNSPTCPSGAVGASTGTFKTFTFWGGMDISGGANTTVNFGTTSSGGQFVMAGSSDFTGSMPLFNVNTNGHLNGNSSVGTMFVLTDGNYSAQGTSLAKPAALASINLYQGYTDIKNANGSLTGVTSSASALSDYKNFLFWQDRRNSTVEYNRASSSACGSCTQDDGTVIDAPASSAELTENHVLPTSPQFVIEPGGMQLSLQGVFYQPRGSWTYLNSGGSGANGNAHLMMVTGALTCGTTGCGNTSVTLLGPVAPIVKYVTSLIQ